MSLDLIRYFNGKIIPGNIYFYLFINHLFFIFFIFPIVTIQRNKEAFAIGRFKYATLFIYTWTIFLGIILITMAILSLIDRGDLTMYSIYIIIANFALIMLHRDRVLLNLLSLIIISFAIIPLNHINLEILVIHLLEAIAITMISFMVSTQIFNAYAAKVFNDKLLEQRNRQIKEEKNLGLKLLHNILPKEIAIELKKTGTVKPRHFSSATVMLIDFKGFSKISKSLIPEQLIFELDYCFKNFDRITHYHNLEKIKTLGDGYLCVGGVPETNLSHPIDCIKAALEILSFLDKWKEEQMSKNEPFFEGRIGIHTGPVIAGVVGDKKFAFDIWGDAVNITARLESNGQAGKINISQTTFELLKHKYNFTHRGKIPIKNSEPIDMYFLDL